MSIMLCLSERRACGICLRICCPVTFRDSNDRIAMAVRSAGLLLWLCVPIVWCQRIIDLIDVPDDYNPRIPPSLAENGTRTIVSFNFIVEDILEVNDRSFSMTIELKMTMHWNDARLQLKPGIFEEHLLEENLVLDSNFVDSIWSPNFSIGHLISFDKLQTLKPADFVMAIPHSLTELSLIQEGTYVIRLKCPLEFNTFPFDKHRCFFEIYVEKPDTSIHVQYQNDDSASWGWAATTTTLDYQTNFKPLDEKHMMREMRFSNGTFIPVSISGFQIELKRKVNYYIFNYFVPSSLFVAVSWVSFIIPPESIPGRIALIITTLLVLVNIANTVFAISPAADAINALQTWILACICFVVSTAIEYSVVLFITRRHRRRKLLTLMHIKNPAQMGSLLFLKKPVVETNNTSSQPHSSANRSTTPNEADNERAMSQRSCQPLESQEEEADRILEAKIANMDFIFILILPAAFGVFNIFYWIMLYSI
ncbi:glycine receptor subunit alphaZ1-like [Tigriopus californicus]|uniref:glycine receptor subunit alphaZ1-like n=1 Tax=Tigriopus californicus TaxID=6832 RepID=UPI0027DA77BD|nr:glycine receptor subunit alphaZ1-like [Tigriopus californicus]